MSYAKNIVPFQHNSMTYVINSFNEIHYTTSTSKASSNNLEITSHLTIVVDLFNANVCHTQNMRVQSIRQNNLKDFSNV